MQLQGVYADTTSSTSAVKGSKELDRDAFMQLLVTQMQNQDPLEPQGNEEFIAQLASFSSLEQMEQMNENLTSLALLQQSNALLSQLSESSSLIGQQVNWNDTENGTSGTGVVESVRLQDGLTFLKIGGQDVPLFTVTDVLGTPPAGADAETATDGASDADPSEPESTDTSETGTDTDAA
jgi:flagellar basal-body rod modification protein FlgD